jgi:hypothetical protein
MRETGTFETDTLLSEPRVAVKVDETTTFTRGGKVVAHMVTGF